jgi:hypothetical protein
VWSWDFVLRIVPILIAAAAVAFAGLAFRASLQQRLRQFEGMYIQRYWSLMDRLSLPATRGDIHLQIEDSDEKVIRAYFRLCEDQLELRQNGWISDRSWRIWSAGITAQLHEPLFNHLWRKVDAEAKARVPEGVPPRFALLRVLIVDEHEDPCEMGRWNRWIAGVGRRRSI